MRLRRLQIERFRGIRTLNWVINGRLICLFGPGDSRKTTVLSAIEAVLSPRWNPVFDDTDFFNGDVNQPMSIIATVDEVPPALMKEEKFGLHIRGCTEAGEIHDEPQESDSHVLSVRLRVDKSMEPEWTVIKNPADEGKLISNRDRETLGMTRLGEDTDRHLTWARGTILTRSTGTVENLPGILAQAGRAARGMLKPEDVAEMGTAAKAVEEAGKPFGVKPESGYIPAIDTKGLFLGMGGVSLHDGKVPLRLAGLGTRRLLGLALQASQSKAGGISLVDEPEYGIEPHRVRRLMDHFASESKTNGQIILTTHSPIILEELNAEYLHAVRCADGVVEIHGVPLDIQRYVKKNSASLLARKVLIGEGKTEVGFARALDDHWAAEDLPFATAGVSLADGTGSDAARSASAIRSLGYDVALFCDSDIETTPTPEELTSQGIHVVMWEGGVAIEERVCLDIPSAGVAELGCSAIDLFGLATVKAQIAPELKKPPSSLPDDPAGWLATGNEQVIRTAIGRAVKKGKWFKSVPNGYLLGQVVAKYLHEIPTSDLRVKTDALRKWVRGYD